MRNVKTAMEKMKPGLTKAIQDWIDSVCDDDDWQELEFFTHADLAAHMSDAAAAVLSASVANQHTYVDEYEEKPQPAAR